MRATFLLVGGLALLLAGCGGKSSQGPPPLNKQLLTGKWKNKAELSLVAAYEFAGDGTLKMIVRGMERPVPGRFAWGGDRELRLKYEANDEVKKAYQAAAKAYKEEVQERVKKGTLPERAAPSILAAARDELPTEETFRVGLPDAGRTLVLTDPANEAQRFEKAE